MSKRLHVGNLAHTVDTAQLETIFATIGKVSNAKVMVGPYDGKSRGFGYVEMSSVKEATDCIERLHGHEHEGRPLAVTEAKPLPPKSRVRR